MSFKPGDFLDNKHSVYYRYIIGVSDKRYNFLLISKKGTFVRIVRDYKLEASYTKISTRGFEKIIEEAKVCLL